jgi:hypothetical protein
MTYSSPRVALSLASHGLIGLLALGALIADPPEAFADPVPVPITCDATVQGAICPGAPMERVTIANVAVNENQINSDIGTTGVQIGMIILCEINLVNNACPNGPPNNLTQNFSDVINFFSVDNICPGSTPTQPHSCVSEFSDNEDGVDVQQDATLMFPPAGTRILAIREPDTIPEVITYIATNKLADGTPVQITYTITSDVNAEVPEPSSLALSAIALFGVFCACSRLGIKRKDSLRLG